MKPEPTQDPIAAMIQAMLNGGCTREQMLDAQIAAFSAEFAHLSDAELEAQYGPSPPWMQKLSDDELNDVILALFAAEGAAEVLSIVAGNEAMTPADLDEIRRSCGEE